MTDAGESTSEPTSILDVVVPPREYLWFPVDYGQRFRMIDVEGQQVAHLVLFNRDNPTEVFSAQRRGCSSCAGVSPPATASIRTRRTPWRRSWRIPQPTGTSVAEGTVVKPSTDVDTASPGRAAAWRISLARLNQSACRKNICRGFRRLHELRLV